MPTNRTGMGIAQFILGLRAHDALGKTDGQLLGRFLNAHDEAAFAALVRRHGTMVFGVCRRILGNAADAEDAFQATFLVLVRKARSLQSRAVVGDWLHGVARRTALKAKGAAAHRWRKEQAMARPEALGADARDDWLPLLDEELSGLPEKYRLPIVLCDLEGRTRQEVAKHLGWPEGTVAGRLARARAMLAKRLVRRGVILPAGTLAAALPTNAASAHVPAAVVSNTIKAATLLAAGETAAEGVMSAKVATLTGEVMKAMLLNKLTTPALLFVACVLGGFGWVGYSSFTNQVAGAVHGADTNATARQNQNAAIEPVQEPIQKEPIIEGKPEIPADVTAGPSARQLMSSLMEPIDLKEFQNPLTFKDALGLFYDIFKNKGREMPILVNSVAFKEENTDSAFDIYETPLKFPHYPRTMTLAAALRIALSQIPGPKAELLIRNGYIEITTAKRAATAWLLQEKVFARFENRPFTDVVHDLADMTGISVNFDPHVEDKTKTSITATFRNDMTLEGALRIVAEMAGLKMVDMKPGIYITTPVRARELEKELRDLQRTPAPVERAIQSLRRRTLRTYVINGIRFATVSARKQGKRRCPILAIVSIAVTSFAMPYSAPNAGNACVRVPA